MSNIDPTLPIYGFPTTASVRENFQIAHDEISTLQSEVAALQGESSTGDGSFLPLTGGTLTGQLIVETAGTGPALFLTKNPTNHLALDTDSVLMLQPADGASNFLRMYGFGMFSQLGINFRASLGTARTPLPVNSSGVLGILSASGYDGKGYVGGAVIGFVADANHTPTGHATRIEFSTCGIGEPYASLKLTVTNEGHLLFGSPITAGYKLDMVLGMARLDAGAGNLPAAPATSDSLTLASPDAVSTRLRAFAFGAAGTNPTLAGFRATGTRAAPARVALSDVLLSLDGYGYGATHYSTASRATINFLAVETWSDTAQGSAIAMQTTRAGTTTTAEAGRWSPNGNLLLGTTTDGAYKLDANGNSRITGTLTVTGSAGFNGSAPPAKPTVSGAKGSNAALASLLTALVHYGLVTDTTTA